MDSESEIKVKAPPPPPHHSSSNSTYRPAVGNWPYSLRWLAFLCFFLSLLFHQHAGGAADGVGGPQEMRNCSKQYVKRSKYSDINV